MAIILTGGTGKSTLPITRSLQDAKIKFVVASSRGEAAAPDLPLTKFDWNDPSTFENPFHHKALEGESVSAIYLVAPESLHDPTPPLTAFVDIAVKKYNVKRFVLLAATLTEIGGEHVGKVWQHLADIGVDHTVLRPTWFQENFWTFSKDSIKEEGKIYTATGDGKIPFVSATDIAAVAFTALTDEKPHNTSYYVLGPELLTYDQLAAKFSALLGREIVHVKVSEEERVQKLTAEGWPEGVPHLLAWVESQMALGLDERLDDAVEKVTGRPPQKIDTFLQDNKSTWQ